MGSQKTPPFGVGARGPNSLSLTCNLTKPEATFDQVRKTYEDLKPTDAALIATALVESGRFAVVVRDDKVFRYPDDHEAMTRSILAEIQQLQQTIDSEVKGTKKAPKISEDEPVELLIQLKPNLEAGELFLGDREDLKQLLAGIIDGDEGVEYLFGATDIQWQWALERVNWSTLSSGDYGRRFKFSVRGEGVVDFVELGPGGKKKTTKSKS